MLMDLNTQFSNAQAITTSAVSTFTYDILQGLALTTSGGVYTVPPPYNIVGNSTYFGEDLGIGSGVGEPTFVVSSGATTPSGGTSLQIGIQSAPDNGGGTLAGLTFVPYIQTRAIPAAAILASSRIASIRFPKREVGQGLYRFVQLAYTVVGTWSGLTLSAQITTGPDDAIGTLPQYPANF